MTKFSNHCDFIHDDDHQSELDMVLRHDIGPKTIRKWEMMDESLCGFVTLSICCN